MKKYLKSLLLIPIIVLLMFTFSRPAEAHIHELDYSITNVDVRAKVNRDGSLNMERRVSYDFDDHTIGIFSRQNVAKGMKLVDPKVKIITNHHKTINVAQSKKIVTGQNHFYMDVQNNSYTFNVWHNINYDKFTVVYTFKLTNAVINWKDTAELNYKIIGDNWSKDLDNTKVEVIFPNSVKNLKAWAHGPLNGKISVLPHQGKIVMTAKNVPKDKGIEVHTLFPTSVTDKNKNIRNKKHKNFVMQEEKQFAREANLERFNVLFSSFGIWLLGLLLNILAIYLVLKRYLFGPKPQPLSKLPHNYKIPSVSPMLAQTLDSRKEPNSKAVTANILWLVGKGQITIEASENGTYNLRSKNYSSLDNDLMRYLFLDVGHDLTLNTEELKSIDRNDLYKKFKNWQLLIIEELYQKGLLDRPDDNTKKDSAGLLGGLTFFGAFAAYCLAFRSSHFVAILTMISLLVGYAIYKFSSKYAEKHYLNYTAKGIETTNEIRGFKKMLKDIGNFKMKDVGDITLWEQILPYAAAFGLSKKVLRQLKLEFPEEDLRKIVFFQNDLNCSDLENSIYHPFFNDEVHWKVSDSISNFLSSNDSSASGDSGGFSSGDSGGFGGGSGDGAL